MNLYFLLLISPLKFSIEYRLRFSMKYKGAGTLIERLSMCDKNVKSNVNFGISSKIFFSMLLKIIV